MDRYHHHYRRRHHSRAKSRPTTAAVPTSPQHRNTSLPLSTLTPTAAPNLQRKTKGRVQRSGRSHLPRSACRQRRISTTPVRRTRVRGQGHPSALAPGPAPDRGSPGALRDGGKDTLTPRAAVAVAAAATAAVAAGHPVALRSDVVADHPVIWTSVASPDPGPGPGPGTNPAGTTGRGGHAHIPTGDDHAHVPALAPEADLDHLFTHGDTGPDIRLSFTLHVHASALCHTTDPPLLPALAANTLHALGQGQGQGHASGA